MYEQQQEGEITFLRPPLPKVPTTNMEVFYNPQSELNRDITIITLQVFNARAKKTKTRVCTPLAGTGVRPIRIAKEVSGIAKVVAGDANPLAVELIKKNRKINSAEEIVDVFHSGANQLLSQYVSFHQRFDVIDIDPFGSPREFLDSAIGALSSHALLCLTATDMPVLVGIRRRTCIKRYAAVPLKTEYAHELALRILLGSAVREAAAHNMGLNPLLSFSVDHYVRTYCEALEGDEATWHAVTQLGFINHCDACGVRFSTPGLIPEQITCPQCQNTPLRIAGPLWIGKFGDKAFINEVIKQVTQFTLGTKRRTTSLLNKLQDEVDGPPTYFNLHHLADKLNIPVPPFSQIIDQLRASGEVCTRTHFSDHAIRTTASESAITQLLLKLNSEL